MLTKEIVIDSINCDEFGNIMYRHVTRIMEDGVELSKSYHRSSLSPGASLTGIDPKVCKMAEATWTPELIAPFTAAVKAKIKEYEAECAACEVAKADAAKAALLEPVAE